VYAISDLDYTGASSIGSISTTYGICMQQPPGMLLSCSYHHIEEFCPMFLDHIIIIFAPQSEAARPDLKTTEEKEVCCLTCHTYKYF